MAAFFLGAWGLLRGAFTFVVGLVVRYPWQAALAVALVFGVVQMREAGRAHAALFNPATHRTWQADYATTRAQQTVAVVSFVRSEIDLVMARVNLAGARHEIDVQNASLQAAADQDAATRQALARSRQEADRAAAASDHRISTIRALEASLRAHGPVCDGALALIRGR